MKITHPRTHVPFLQVNDPSLEAGSIKIYGKNGITLHLGDATHEGGDISIYRDTSGNKQLSLDADAASNAIALSVYGGVVAQNHLTVGQTSLGSSALHVIGNIYASSYIRTEDSIYFSTGQGVYAWGSNAASLIAGDIIVDGTNSTSHSVKLRIDRSNIIEIKATGDGAGGITNKAIGVFDATPQVQQAHIADADGTLADITTKFNQLKADIEGFGFNAGP